MAKLSISHQCHAVREEKTNAVCKQECFCKMWGNSSVLLGTGKASVGVLSVVLGIPFQEECGSVEDGWKAAQNIRGLKNVRNSCRN